MTSGVNGTVCNSQQYQQSLSSPSPISCLTREQTIGLVVTVEASLLSLIFVITIFILIGRNVQRYRKTLPKDDWKLLEVPADIFLFSIFICDFLQALGGLLNIRWVHDGIVKSGSYCTAQGSILQGSELAAALITLMLAVHTFVTALWSVDLQSRGFGFSLVGVICVFSALWVGVGNSIHRNYEEPTPFWCWISSAFEGERLAGEYIWLWITLFASVIMYIPLYFWAEGRLSVDRQRWYKFHLNNPDDRVGYTKRRAALGMLFYPLAYSLMVLPLSVARWSLGTRNTLPSLALFFGICTFSLSGVINVSMFWIIRRGRLLFIPPEETSKSEMELTPPVSPPKSANVNQSLQPHGVTPGELPRITIYEGSANTLASATIDHGEIPI